MGIIAQFTKLGDVVMVITELENEERQNTR